MARWAFNFGAQERFLMAAFGLTIIASLSTKSIIKGLMMGCLGLLIACVGMDPVMGRARFTFGSTYLMGGITMIPVVIGLFSDSQVFISLRDSIKPAREEDIIRYKRARFKLKDFCYHPATYLWSSIVGLVIGIIPGTGGDVASYVSYNIGKIVSKERDQFGQGSRDAVAACEASNNAVTGGAMIPLTTLGIPGDSVTAILLGAFIMKGIQPGPMMYISELPTVYKVFAALMLANLAMLVVGCLGVRFFAKIVSVEKKMLYPIILVISLLGAFSINKNVFDVGVCVVFGIIGWLMNKYDTTLNLKDIQMCQNML